MYASTFVLFSENQIIRSGAFHFFALDEFIMRREIWMSQLCHAYTRLQL